jgi:Protein of unknown function (DUF2914)/Tetratricopeptide repeat
MPEARDLRSVVESAEQAAAAGDYASAERLLREASLLQEATLGPLHPDLASTLNNLGVVYETIDKPADAERCYRRAYSIATASLAPDHPFVATSGKNLRDFCEARGLPFVLPTPPRAGAPQSEPPRRSSRTVVIGGLGALIIIIIIITLVATRSRFSSNEQAEPSSGNAIQRSAGNPALTPEPVPNKSIPPPKPPTSSGSGPTTVRKSNGIAAAAPAPPTVVDALLCRNLSTNEWRCDPVSGPVDPGVLFFYTRVKSAGDTTVQHRWYRGGRVRQVVELPIRANPGSGYRTYSRQTVNAEGTGEWRVELRTNNGTLLHEERFIVR